MLKTKELKGMQTYFILHNWMTDKLELHGVSLLVYGLELSRIVQSKKHPKFLIDYCAVCRLQSL